MLFVDDSAADVEMLLGRVRARWPRLELHRVETLGELGVALDDGVWDAVLCEWATRGVNPMRALELTRDVAGDVPFLYVLGAGGEEAAANAMRAGANDYILKSGLARLVPALERELREHEIHVERRRSERALRVQETRFRALVEKSQDGIFMTAADGSLLYISPTGKALLGIDPGARDRETSDFWRNGKRP